MGNVPETGFGNVDPGGISHLVIKVESMQADDFWTSWLTDPDGYRIELVQWPAGHPDGMTQADMSGRVARD